MAATRAGLPEGGMGSPRGVCEGIGTGTREAEAEAEVEAEAEAEAAASASEGSGLLHPAHAPFSLGAWLPSRRGLLPVSRVARTAGQAEMGF